MVQAVDTLSQLNKEIKSGLVWCERIRFHCDVVKGGANEVNGQVSSGSQGCDYVLIPVSQPPGLHQLFSFQSEMSFEFMAKSSMRVYFTREDGKRLKFNAADQSQGVKIQYTFIEGQTHPY